MVDRLKTVRVNETFTDGSGQCLDANNSHKWYFLREFFVSLPTCNGENELQFKYVEQMGKYGRCSIMKLQKSRVTI